MSQPNPFPGETGEFEHEQPRLRIVEAPPRHRKTFGEWVLRKLAGKNYSTPLSAASVAVHEVVPVRIVQVPAQQELFRESAERLAELLRTDELDMNDHKLRAAIGYHDEALHQHVRARIAGDSQTDTASE